MIRALVLLMALLLGAASASGQAPAPQAGAVDFLRDVYPIFRAHCLRCHGAEKQDGSLRLDQRKYAERGGHTGSPILGGDLSTNAVYQRVATHDTEVRMPKNAPPLADDEIAVIRAWVEQGAPWEDPHEPEPRSAGDPDALRFAFTWEDLRDWNPWRWSDARLARVIQIVYALAGPLFAVLILILLCERAKLWTAAEVEGRSHRAAWAIRGLARVPRSAYVAALLAIVVGFSAMYYQEQARRADQQIEALRGQVEMLQVQDDPLSPQREPGKAPRPVRPPHPPRLGGEYYRGNDERSHDLFNGGFYRTATMRVDLCDAQRRPLAWNDEVSGDRLWIRFEIERSPFTTSYLFNENVWRNTFVSALPPGRLITDREEQLIPLEQQDEDRWAAFYPLKAPADGAEPATGVVYLYYGDRSAARITAAPHYAAEYSLRITGGRIDPRSELWMGYLLKTGNVARTPPGRIPEDEWFSFRPIPEIPADQGVDDPDLLGVTEHQKHTPTKPPTPPPAP